MVCDNAESSFQAPYLPYGEVLLADFATCLAPDRVLRYVHVLWSVSYETFKIFTTGSE